MRRVKALLTTVALTATLAAAVPTGPVEAAGPLTQVSSILLGTNAHDVVVSEGFAYVATGKGLAIVDVSNPKAPVVRGKIESLGKTLGLDLKGAYVYLASVTKDLQIVDVTDPDLPKIVGFKTLPGNTWDVAVKENIAYVASFSGELYLIDVSILAKPRQIQVLGLPAWSNAGQDATNVPKLENEIASGGAKVTGVAVAGNLLAAVDWNYGRLYYYDVTDPANPAFMGTHYAPFLLRVDVDPDNRIFYALGAYGSSSGVYSIPAEVMDADDVTPPLHSTRQESCATCDFFQSPTTDYGGLTVVPGGKYVVYVAGKQGRVRVLDVTNPADIKDVGSIATGMFYVKTADSLGVHTVGDHIFVAAGSKGLQIYYWDGLSE